VATVAYIFHARRTPAPILDLRLLKLATFRASIFGGFMFRLGIGAHFCCRSCYRSDST
jgi:hypothetical protein